MKETKLKEIEKILRSHPFITPKFLQNAHIQTLLPRLIPYFKTKLPEAERRFVKLPDGSQLAADCWWQKDKEKCLTIVVIGGIEGYKRKKTSRFVINMAHKTYYLKYNVIHITHRGEGDSLHLSKTLGYNIIDDLQIAFEQLKSWGIKKFFVVGYSVGGGSLFFALGKLGKKAKEYILGAVTISAPTRLLETWKHVEKNILYDKILLKFYKDLIRRRAKIDPPGTWDLEELKKIKTKHDWLNKYMNFLGFGNHLKTIEDLDKETDATKMFPKIQVPTLIIHAYDDPFIPMINGTILHNPNLITLLTKHGGHGGFFTTKKLYGDLDGHWAQNRAMEFIKLL